MEKDISEPKMGKSVSSGAKKPKHDGQIKKGQVTYKGGKAYM